MRSRLNGLALVTLALLHASPAMAYIDPGTGSALIYVISGIVLSIYFAARGAYYRLIEWAFRIRHKDQRCAIALHCEDPRYEITFLPVIKALALRGMDLTLFTMYERDCTFEALPEGVTHRAIAPGMVGYAYLNNLQAELLVTTTPQIDVMTFRRSPRVKHYSMIAHALGESRYVRPYAYDHFDSVLCCGKILKNNIRRMEAIREAPAKQLLETGIPHWEVMAQRAHEIPAPVGAPVVLVAPSWGPLSMFEAFGTEFVKQISHRYRVIVRPHPQMRFSQPALYERVLALQEHGVSVDTDRTPSTAMSQAHILLSDISGITHEFAFIYERPVVIIDRALASGGLEGELLGGDSELKEACKSFIVPVPPDEIDSVVRHLDATLQNHRKEQITAVRDQLIYNFGSASDVAAEQIAAIFLRVAT